MDWGNVNTKWISFAGGRDGNVGGDAGQEDVMMKAGTEESRNNNCIEDFP